jgi:hypothetical protein
MPGQRREKRPYGNDLCPEGHSYPSAKAVDEEVIKRIRREAVKQYIHSTAPFARNERIEASINITKAVVESVALFVEGHSCASSCCNAQPSSGEAKSLADCIRANVVP